MKFDKLNGVMVNFWFIEEEKKSADRNKIFKIEYRNA